MIPEGVNQGDLLSMVLYSIILVPLAKVFRTADLGLLSLFYMEDAAFDSSEQLSAHLLKLLMKSGSDQGCFPNLAKSLFISNTSGQEEVTRRELLAE